MQPVLLTALPLKADIEKALESLQITLINFKCDTNLKQMLCETNFQDFFYFLWQKGTFPVLRYFDLRITATFGSTYAYEQFFCLMNNNKRYLNLLLRMCT
jgi:hypothetical protein